MFAGGADGGNGHLPRPRRARRGGGGGGGMGSPPLGPPPPPCTDYDMAYFKAYSHIGVHEEMLKDHVRTNTYRNAIMHHQDLISGKVIIFFDLFIFWTTWYSWQDGRLDTTFCPTNLALVFFFFF
uniref:Arginine methyltransferase (Alternative splicing) n=1 Tax=Oryza sativa subsp. japonica TaxID=39947 RepID=Q75G67_ORYSJ|nr:putative arginine methyltransferase (alternative splicing) [Oryza sativa Japonica Group]